MAIQVRRPGWEKSRSVTPNIFRCKNLRLVAVAFTFLSFFLYAGLRVLDDLQPFHDGSSGSTRRGLSSFSIQKDLRIIKNSVFSRKSLLQEPGFIGADGNAVVGSNSKIQVMAFVGIQTGFDSAERRKALRETWMPAVGDDILGEEQSTGLLFRFVIGHSSDAQKEAQIEKEHKKYKDFVRLDIEENYKTLNKKTLAFFRFAFEHYNADYYVKVDDDVYLRPDRLAALLAKERPSTHTYIGCMKKGPVITNPGLKWHEPLGHLLGQEYFLHAYGPLYVLSAGVVADLHSVRENSLRMFSNEDVTIGSWMLAMNVEYEDNRRICETQCSPTSISVWDIPQCSGLCDAPRRLKELHNMDMCSKSPTSSE